MQIGILDVITILLMFISLCFAVFLFTAKKVNKLSNLLLGSFLVFTALEAGSLFIDYFIFKDFPGIGMILSYVVFLPAPILFLYIVSIIYSDFKFKSIHFWHLLPFLLVNALLIPNFYFISYEDKLLFLKGGVEGGRLEIVFSYYLAHLQLIFYIFLSIITVKKYGLLLRENYSSTAANNYQWIYQLIIIFSIASSITIFKNIVRYFEAIKLLAIAEFISHFIPLAFIVWIVFNALKKPYLFQAIESTLKLSKSKKIKANNEESLEKLDKLKEFMNENKPYLDPLLSIDSLSNQMNTSSTELSLLINQHLGEHFFNFVNRYRISYAQELLVDPQRKNLTVAEIMYDSGFNSKSSFFTAFKKQTGKTPKQFRASG